MFFCLCSVLPVLGFPDLSGSLCCCLCASVLSVNFRASPQSFLMEVNAVFWFSFSCLTTMGTTMCFDIVAIGLDDGGNGCLQASA